MFRERRCYFAAGLLSSVTMGIVVVLPSVPLSGWYTSGVPFEKALIPKQKAAVLPERVSDTPLVELEQVDCGSDGS